MSTYDYQCPLCGNIKQWTHSSPPGNGVWHRSCCWNDQRIVWCGDKIGWQTQGNCDVPISSQSKQTPQGQRYMAAVSFWEAAAKEDEIRWQKEMVELERKRNRSSSALGVPLNDRKDTPKKSTNLSVSVVPTWWKYLKTELLKAAHLNRLRAINDQYARDWAGFKPGRCVDNHMISEGRKRFRSCRASFGRLQSDYYGAAGQSGLV